MKNYLDKLPQEVFNKIMLYNSHPVSDLFKKELEEELNEHYRILPEGPYYEIDCWCEDDDFLFAYECLKRKLSDNNTEFQMYKLRAKYNWWD